VSGLNLADLVMIAWLLVKGVDEEKWAVEAS